ncbi:MAG: pantoate--beta-alanine ligase [Isosphaeraceae bacterium]
MLTVVHQIAEVREAISAARAQGNSIGFVPTMGALHEGHARLIEASREESTFVVVSIFVNPTQFGPTEDYERYPRTLEADLERSERAGADLIFAPTAREMYPRGTQGTTFVEVPGLSSQWEGTSRPTHFRGVTTVVLKLFAIVRPDLAYFGAKDYQQQLIIRRMVEDLNLPVTIRALPTVREPDGLAMSSRNRYLNPDQRRGATVLFRALERARTLVREGERDANRVRQELTRTIESEREARLDYAEVADAETLETLQRIDPGREAVGLLAVRFGETRLIDNAILKG